MVGPEARERSLRPGTSPDLEREPHAVLAMLDAADVEVDVWRWGEPPARLLACGAQPEVEELEPELTRISLRSKDKNVNVSDIAGLFGGGGHPAAAGARIPGKLPTTQRRVVAAIRKALDARPS